MNSTTPLYSLHERIWHWLQAAVMILLILTGIGDPLPRPLRDSRVHGHRRPRSLWLALALILNAFLGAFYHLTAEKYHHFLPKMDDFTGAAVLQARFYLYGIFKGEKHPMETDPRRKLNPLQKITYLAVLNILLPFQIVTGVLMWGADRWPDLFDRAGGLWLLGPAHTLGAYLFLAFLIGHIYLATTGPTPSALVRAITTGRAE